MADVETEIRALCQAGEIDQALTAALEAYGDEVYSFLLARMRDEDRAGDVFSQACEDLWKSLPAFSWRCSLRTWFYRLARSAVSRHSRSPANQAERRVELSQVSELADRVRSRTRAHLRTDVKDEIRKIRDELAPEDQELLVLRVDRALGWLEIAHVVADETPLDDEELARASARLRQRFQKLKAQLRELAIARGLLDAE
jgi:RNA polymerase sigma-70 factor, ECF subfamily